MQNVVLTSEHTWIEKFDSMDLSWKRQMDWKQQGVSTESVTGTKRRSNRLPGHAKFFCFIYNTISEADGKPFNEEGLIRSYDKLQESMQNRNQGEDVSLDEAGERLDILLSRASYDIFAVDVFYHKLCYASFTCHKASSGLEKKTEESLKKQKVLEEFFSLTFKHILRDKEAYLLSDLLNPFSATRRL